MEEKNNRVGRAIPVLGVLVLNRGDLLERLVRSIDYPVERLVIVQQGDVAEVTMTINMMLLGERGQSFPKVEQVHHVFHPNAGVAGGWNEVIKLFPASWWMFAGNDIQFAPGDLEKMAVASWEHAESERQWASLFGNHGHSFFVITREGVERVGLFDENIYPAYLEDCDWMWRRHQAGMPYKDVAGVQAIHGDGKLTGSCTIQSDPKIMAQNGRTHRANFEYYQRKWGGINGQEVFTRPFNDLNWPMWCWKYEPRIRERNQWR